MIGVLNYGSGNLPAFRNIYDDLGIPLKIISTQKDFDGVEKIILPGVGNFGFVMNQLHQSGLMEPLNFMVKVKKVPVLGVCVGFQIMAKRSEEGGCAGLGWLDAEVVKFPETAARQFPLPHMGWNSLEMRRNPLFQHVGSDAEFYFLHSYYVKTENQTSVVASAAYGKEFPAAIQHENIYGIQCHPERSHHWGQQLLKNFAEL